MWVNFLSCLHIWFSLTCHIIFQGNAFEQTDIFASCIKYAAGKILVSSSTQNVERVCALALARQFSVASHGNTETYLIHFVWVRHISSISSRARVCLFVCGRNEAKNLLKIYAINLQQFFVVVVVVWHCLWASLLYAVFLLMLLLIISNVVAAVFVAVVGGFNSIRNFLSTAAKWKRANRCFCLSYDSCLSLFSMCVCVCNNLLYILSLHFMLLMGKKAQRNANHSFIPHSSLHAYLMSVSVVHTLALFLSKSEKSTFSRFGSYACETFFW